MHATELLELALKGESQNLEFKSSMRFDIRTGQGNRDLAKVIPKTMAAFLNCNGGILLIGVDDDGNVIGIQPDIDMLSKRTIDYFELTVRTCIGQYLGIEQSSGISIEFVKVDDLVVAKLECDPSNAAVYFEDGDKREFYIRDGNSSKPLNVRDAHGYIQRRFPPEVNLLQSDVQRIAEAVSLSLRGTSKSLFPDCETPSSTTGYPEVSARLQQLSLALAALATDFSVRQASAVPRSETKYGEPPWLKVATSRVLDSFLKQLSGSTGWKRIYLVSPWISDITNSATMQFTAFLRRICDEGTTVYVVTRPPKHDWHQDAVSKLARTGRANIVYIENMHAKLYTALTNSGRFALLGSANFTQSSLAAEEIGVLVNAFMQGKQVMSRLDREAERIYRTPGRTLAYKARFDAAVQ